MKELDLFYGLTFVIPCVLGGILFLLYKLKTSGIRNRNLFIVGWNLLFTLLLLFVFFFIGESYFRFFVDSTDSFAVSKISQRWMKRYYQPNNLSARDNVDYQLAIAPGKRRLTIIGDSFTAGHGIKNVDNRFGNILRKRYPELEVHIMAINGLASVDELEMLKKLERDQYQFDIVLLAYCLNDIDYLMPETKEIYGRIYEFEKNLGYLGNQSYLVNTLKFKWFAFQDPDFLNYSDFVIEAYQGGTWNTHKNTLTRIREFAQKRSKAFAVVTFPFLQNQNSTYKFLKVHEDLNEFWNSENVMHLDLLETFSPYMGDDLTVNRLDAHPNEFANELAAREIGGFLKTN